MATLSKAIVGTMPIAIWVAEKFCRNSQDEPSLSRRGEKEAKNPDQSAEEGPKGAGKLVGRNGITCGRISPGRGLNLKDVG